MVRQAILTLKGMKADTSFILLPHLRGAVLDVRVSKATVTRALLIMDALLKAFEEAGWSVEIRPREYSKKGFATVVTVDGIDLHVSLHERCRQIQQPISEDERNTWERYWPGVEHRQHTVTMVPSGELYLSLGSVYIENERCRDGKRAKLEQKLDAFMAEMADESARRREQAEKRAQADRERHERHLEVQRIAEARERERQRFDRLVSLSEEWHRSQQILGLIDAVHTELQMAPDSVVDRPALEAWMSWARTKAERINPVQLLLAGKCERIEDG